MRLLHVNARADIVRAGQRNLRRLAAFAAGAAMWASILLLDPGRGRAVIAVGATMCWVALRQPKRTEVSDPELLAIVHNRIAEQDEKVAARLDRLLADLREPD